LFIAADIKHSEEENRYYALVSLSTLEPIIVDKDGKKTFFQFVPFSSYDIHKNLYLSQLSQPMKLFNLTRTYY